MSCSEVLGSSAAVCSSSSNNSGLTRVAMRKLNAWRCPPERSPVAVCKRVSKLFPITLVNWAYSASFSLVSPRGRNVRFWPRFSANNRFSATVIRGAVPILGSWKTRAMVSVRETAVVWVISCPLCNKVPDATGRLPAIVLNKVDFPAPLVPSTVMKSPS